MSFGSSKPSVPAPPKPPGEDPKTRAAAEEEARRILRNQAGRASTVLTGPLGVESSTETASIARKKLMGQ